ncbi:aconitate hydratase [Aneurinibacillus migulanus]|uniref:aconitate hydratase AcnA n=1 Tax=Aneurinibacillus migulanus TaxID=47500 RepID=UPI0005BD8D61|nr:aconitate hydratase AcnA [Aneurinibacillus migulanus]KIV51676.1 aconitate hydratase [Aneurinibacillus migulanus]KPD08382.1 aconitate hydratase [Aneurinibacillus migulanus]
MNNDKTLREACRTRLDGGMYYYRLQTLEEQGIGEISRLPFSIKILLEAALRAMDNRAITEEHVKRIANWDPHPKPGEMFEIPFMPSRVILQDFTGVPAVVDLASMRDAVSNLGLEPGKINPLIPVDLVIDHSVQVDQAGSDTSLSFNMDKEFERNRERYTFLRWATQAFTNFRAVPPSVGIVHQVNLEYLASVVSRKDTEDGVEVFPDSLVGTDSHTTMINGLGVLGWGVGGIEAEASMLGQPMYFLLPHVVGFELTGKLPEGSTATDLALTVTNILRKKGVVGKFVEFFGKGLNSMTLEDRATIANMAPEYGATAGYFPIDEQTLRYLRTTGRSEEHISLVETYTKAQGLFRTDDMPDPNYSEIITLDLGSVVPTLAGPKRPQDRINLTEMKESFNKVLRTPVKEGGFGLTEEKLEQEVTVTYPDGSKASLKTGSVVIAAITSCTNTSNPSVMIGAGLLAKKAVEKGLRRNPNVKSSLAPGSRVVTQYLDDAGLTPYLDRLGFNTVGYGCTTCIGNSGPLIPEVGKAVAENDMTVTSVLSGNRNFEGRIHPLVKANYLASPPLVVAYALAGTFNIDLYNDPIGHNEQGDPVYLRDIWPSEEEVRSTINSIITPEMYREKYNNVLAFNKEWNEIPISQAEIYSWDKDSTYIQSPPFFTDFSLESSGIQPIRCARLLALLGDSVTTDHISPAGAIKPDSPAGQYLQGKGVEVRDFNSYGSRRGNHEVMMRGTFANIRIRNHLAPGTEGGYTTYLPTGEVMSIYDAAMKYQESSTPLMIIGGKEYGTGSSRDWAAKGTLLLGVKAVIAESYERIHRTNLVCMGVLPLQFEEGISAEALGITGQETFDIPELNERINPRQKIEVHATRSDGSSFTFQCIVRLDTDVEIDYYKNGGILQLVLRKLITDKNAPVSS